jgi:hypothetical protein
MIDIAASFYDHLKEGLRRVELELPTEISFYIPDQFHKRIIGIGGQHIQRVMKRHFVFVKFLNAAEMGMDGRLAGWRRMSPSPRNTLLIVCPL